MTPVSDAIFSGYFFMFFPGKRTHQSSFFEVAAPPWKAEGGDFK